MMDFIASDSKMFTALHNNDWAGFAKRYNGPGYKKNKYDTKLASAYRKWVRLVDGRGKVEPPVGVPEPSKHEEVSKPADQPKVHWLVWLVRLLIGIFKK
jgi:site-specific recombinase XerC